MEKASGVNLEEKIQSGAPKAAGSSPSTSSWQLLAFLWTTSARLGRGFCPLGTPGSPYTLPRLAP